jgi:hypothetical protein
VTDTAETASEIVKLAETRVLLRAADFTQLPEAGAALRYADTWGRMTVPFIDLLHIN